MRCDAQGRPIIAAPWGAINGIPSLVSQLGALADPGADRFLKWDDTTNTLVWGDGLAGSTTNITLGFGGGFNVDLWELMQRPAGVVTVTLVIPYGCWIGSLDASLPALDLRGFASGSTINLVNSGHILGAGGHGGRGGFRLGGSEDHTFAAEPGTNGGPAIWLPGAGRTVNVTNSVGYIWGGGGGGGGGGGANLASGGGGGGGAGGGRGGVAFQTNDGVNGTTGPKGALGAGGAGAGDPNRGGVGQAGGAGGTWGAAGIVGTNGASFNGAAAGAAGKAIELAGGTVSWAGGSGSPNVIGAVS